MLSQPRWPCPLEPKAKINCFFYNLLLVLEFYYSNRKVTNTFTMQLFFQWRQFFLKGTSNIWKMKSRAIKVKSIWIHEEKNILVLHCSQGYTVKDCQLQHCLHFLTELYGHFSYFCISSNSISFRGTLRNQGAQVSHSQNCTRVAVLRGKMTFLFPHQSFLSSWVRHRNLMQLGTKDGHFQVWNALGSSMRSL